MSVLDILQEKIYVLLPLCNYLRVVCGSKVQRHGRRTEEKLERATQIPATMSVVLHAQDIVNSNSLIAVQYVKMHDACRWCWFTDGHILKDLGNRRQRRE